MRKQSQNTPSTGVTAFENTDVRGILQECPKAREDMGKDKLAITKKGCFNGHLDELDSSNVCAWRHGSGTPRDVLRGHF